MNPKERLEELEDLLEKLRNDNLEFPVVVEGEKDERALRRIGLEGDIIKINVGDTLFHLCENLARRYDRVIILTDWDRTGGRLARSIREGLDANVVGYDLAFRADLARLCKKEIKDVEGLPGYLTRLRRDVETRHDRFAKRRGAIKRVEVE